MVLVSQVCINVCLVSAVCAVSVQVMMMMMMMMMTNTLRLLPRIDGVMEELARSLGDIQMVKGAVQITRSEGINSLSFLRNLIVIAPSSDQMLINNR